MNSFIKILLVSFLFFSSCNNDTVFSTQEEGNIQNIVKASLVDYNKNNIYGKYKYIKDVPNASHMNHGFSRYAVPGKISVFIISAHWCKPCYDLKDQFENAFAKGIISPDDVDVYNYMVSDTNRDGFEVLNKRASYRHLKYIDGLTAVFPTSYITTQTTNCYTIEKGNKYETIMEHIQNLLEVKKYFNEECFVDNCSNSMSNSQSKIRNLENKIAKLEEENTKLKNLSISINQKPINENNNNEYIGIKIQKYNCREIGNDKYNFVLNFSNKDISSKTIREIIDRISIKLHNNGNLQINNIPNLELGNKNPIEAINQRNREGCLYKIFHNNETINLVFENKTIKKFSKKFKPAQGAIFIEIEIKDD